MLALAATAVGGCGGGGDGTPAPTEPQRVAHTVRAFLQAQSQGDTAKTCSLLTVGGRRQLVAVIRRATGGAAGGLTCEDASGLVRVAAGTSVLTALATADVRGVRVRGAQATAVVVDGKVFGRRVVRLRRTTIGWRISAVPRLLG